MVHFKENHPFFNMNLNTLCSSVRALALTAGNAILDIYNDTFDVEYKDDQSPLTKADLAANDIICAGLKKLTPDIPIVSEENKQIEYAIRKDWRCVWLVDPLDGTKEFINKNGDFTVNIALVKNGEPILGVVYVPVTKEMYWAYSGGGAWKHTVDETVQLHTNTFDNTAKGVKIVASRSHNTPETEEYINTFNSPIVLSRGSSLKLLMVAEGQADVYPRIAPTMEWDTAAADVIVREAGGRVLQYGTDQCLKYNKPNLLNPFFVVCGRL